ncbi:MAG: hypothetical protein KatS3mg131_1497 [Candidatus Tectimicrobiota bacterium]|nr:MAG: hypothetical protein KatS3mg131_1497 [Candidatus Tectomicrobia bacterium]
MGKETRRRLTPCGARHCALRAYQGHGPWIVVLIAAVALLCGSAGLAAAENFSGMWVFGDSLSDTGNAFLATGDTVPPSPPYFAGRFSNGPVWVEHLAEDLGLAVLPALAGGSNFAFGGARAAGVLVQVSLYLRQQRFRADPQALYVVWGGASDIRDAVQAAVTGKSDKRAAAAALRRAVRRLARSLRLLALAGARQFLILNLPDLGAIPETRALGEAAVALATALTEAFNAALGRVVQRLAALPGVWVVWFDTFAQLNAVLEDPAAFGFAQVTESCLDGDPFTFTAVCSDDPAVQNTYLFWDILHPTAAAHALLAAEVGAALAALPAAGASAP